MGSRSAKRQEEGRKDRPCVIALAVEHLQDGETLVTVLPVTIGRRKMRRPAVEIPRAVKQQLGLDDDRSWVVVSEGDQFSSAGIRLRKVPEQRSIRLWIFAAAIFPGCFWQRFGLAQGAQSCADAKVTDGSTILRCHVRLLRSSRCAGPKIGEGSAHCHSDAYCVATTPSYATSPLRMPMSRARAFMPARIRRDFRIVIGQIAADQRGDQLGSLRRNSLRPTPVRA